MAIVLISAWSSAWCTLCFSNGTGCSVGTVIDFIPGYSLSRDLDRLSCPECTVGVRYVRSMVRSSALQADYKE